MRKAWSGYIYDASNADPQEKHEASSDCLALGIFPAFEIYSSALQLDYTNANPVSDA